MFASKLLERFLINNSKFEFPEELTKHKYFSVHMPEGFSDNDCMDVEDVLRRHVERFIKTNNIGNADVVLKRSFINNVEQKQLQSIATLTYKENVNRTFFKESFLNHLSRNVGNFDVVINPKMSTLSLNMDGAFITFQLVLDNPVKELSSIKSLLDIYQRFGLVVNKLDSFLKVRHHEQI